MSAYSVGNYLATRLAQIGLKHHFVVPGDYNLVLLDKLLEQKDMEQVGSCNELNASFSAEGYARAHGVGACVVTFSVGALSALDGIGSAYAESLPVILVSGSPNSNDPGSHHLLHHTTGTYDFSYVRQMAEHVTCCAVAIDDAEEAPYLIDKAIRAALLQKKPVYIEIPCNLAGAPCTEPGPVSALTRPETSDPATLQAAVDATIQFLRARKKPILLGGSLLRSADAEGAFRKLADALGCAVALQPAAKGMFAETYAGFAGIALGEVSSPGCNDILNWADGTLCVGTLFTDYSTVGWTAQPDASQSVQAGPDRVQGPGFDFSGIVLSEFLIALAAKVKANPTTLHEFQRIKPSLKPIHAPSANTPLDRTEITRQVQQLLSADSTLLVETGDAWFNGMYLDLPEGARFEIEMQWGHIGWSIPAAFGYAVGAPQRKLITMCGDGSFQLTAQEVAQMIRRGLPVLIFLINNRGYTIEVEIHDGPYNNIKNWNYAALMQAFNAEDGAGLGLQVGTTGELAEAITKAAENRKGPTLIECSIERDDCTHQLITWGRRVATANARPPVRR